MHDKFLERYGLPSGYFARPDEEQVYFKCLMAHVYQTHKKNGDRACMLGTEVFGTWLDLWRYDGEEAARRFWDAV